MGKVVLVHGAWHGVWCWDLLRQELIERGVESESIELPFSGLSNDVAVAKDAISNAGERVVVCGHSYGGQVITWAASGLRNVARLVYLAAFQVDDNEDSMTMQGRESTPLMSAITATNQGIIVDPSRLHEVFYEDSSPSVVERIAPLLRPMPLSPPEFVHSGPPAWKATPSTYVVTLRDKAIAPSTQKFMATRANAVIEWDTDHSPFLTRPGELADLLASYC